ncbi:hypothetical protein TWF694_007421 [Orbilia ellipsospora]|uniref:Uncharacterized protein n=1 Tax=Orbilia ellipsospora TaxID=2528407 RepID=A0AAV9XI50_9PEZI
MGCHIALNCEHQDYVQANADVAGNGVLAAFLASAFLTVYAMAYGYLSDSLPKSSLNETDQYIIEYFRTKPVWIHSTLSTLKGIQYKFCALVMRLFRKEYTPAVQEIPRKKREEAVSKFILALSDQQLATGLAIMIAAVANQCTLTNYDFRIAFSLAWFSAITHLATLDCLQEYFRTHRTIWNMRLIGVVAFLGLLVSGMIPKAVDISLPVACRSRPSETDPSTLDTTFFDPISFGLFLIPWFLLWVYLRRIIRQYNLKRRKDYILQAVIPWFGICKPPAFRPTEAERKRYYEHLFAEKTARDLRKSLDAMKASSVIKRNFAMFVRVLQVYDQSFLSQTPPLIFMLAYGLSQIIYSQWFSVVEVRLDTSMGFGQIIPLFLLVLPIFAAAEIYYETKENPDRSAGQTEVDESNIPSDEPSHIEPEPHSLNRAETLLLSASDSTNPDLPALEADGILYDKNVSQIERYFYKETKEIERLWNSAATVENVMEVLQKKQKYQVEFQAYKSIEEDSVSMTTSVVWMYIISASSLATLGVILNIKTVVSEIGSAFFTLVMVIYIQRGVGSYLFSLVAMREIKPHLQDIFELVRPPLDSQKLPTATVST